MKKILIKYKKSSFDEIAFFYSYLGDYLKDYLLFDIKSIFPSIEEEKEIEENVVIFSHLYKNIDKDKLLYLINSKKNIEEYIDKENEINNYDKIFEYISYIQRKINIKHVNNGNIFESIDETKIGKDVIFGKGNIIEKNAIIIGKSAFINQNFISSFSFVEKSVLSNYNKIVSSTVINSNIGNSNILGPYCNVHHQSKIGNNVIIGNFVEIKNSSIGSNSKVKHLSYVGDATLGERVNIGSGVVVCNYDGKTKNHTLIHDDVFIGSNSTLISPLIIEEKSFIAAGSIITENVPSFSLAIGRARQMNKNGYYKHKETKC